MAAGVIKVLDPKDKPFYDCKDVMSLLHVGKNKAYRIIGKARSECIAKGLSEEYPEGRVPKKYFDKKFML